MKIKRRLTTTILVILTVVSGTIFVSANSAHATTTPSTNGNASSTQANIPTTIPQNNIIPQSAFGPIMIAIMDLFAWLMGVAVLTLDNAVYYTVVTMGAYINHLSAVGETWRMLRDISNIMLIFGFMTIGIATIVDADFYGSRKKLLPALIIAAVLVNFSIFITEAVIDIGNVFASEIYLEINGGTSLNSTGFTMTNISKEGISDKIMSQLGLQTIYGEALQQNPNILKGNNSFFVGFLGIILFIIVSFVMFSLAFILIARFVILLFLIIISPIGIVGRTIPGLEKYAKQWQDSLVRQTITAPVLLLALYIALRIITDGSFLSGFMTGNTTAAGSWTGFFQNGSSGFENFAGVFLSFLVAMGFLCIVIILSKKLGAAGVGLATKIGGGITFGALALGGQYTLGQGSSFAARHIRKSSFGQTEFGRKTAGLLDNGAKKTYDFRNLRVPGLKLEKLELGEGMKRSYESKRQKNISERDSYARGLTLSGEQQKNLKVLKDKREDLPKAEKEKLKNEKERYEAEKSAATSERDVQKELVKTKQEDINAEKTGIEAERQSIDMLQKHINELKKPYASSMVGFQTSSKAEESNKAKAELDAAMTEKQQKETALQTRRTALQGKEQNLQTTKQILAEREEQVVTINTMHQINETEIKNSTKEEAARLGKEINDAENAAQHNYAKRLSKSGFVQRTVFGSGVKEASYKIEKAFGANKDKKLLENLKNWAKEEAIEVPKEETKVTADKGGSEATGGAIPTNQV